MKLDSTKKIAFGIFILVGLIFSVAVLFTSPVSKSNSRLINGKFNAIVKEDHKGEVSYDLYIEGDNKYYKIPADWAGCFLYYSFQSNVKKGQLIQIYINKGFSFSSVPEVISLIADGVDYMSQVGINKKISENKIRLPLFVLGSIIAVGIYFYLKGKKKAS